MNLELKKPKGFTLTELLVVAAVIAILAALMVPLLKSMFTRAENPRAFSTVYKLKNAVSAYVTEYRKYPVRTGGQSETDVQVYSDHALMDVLLAADNESGPGGLNEKRITFYAGRQAKLSSDGGFRHGIRLTSGGAGELWDPYGEYYRLILDTNFDERLATPAWYHETAEMIPATVAVWSAGKDRDDAKSKDNPKTW